jgi:hypothetical protein
MKLIKYIIINLPNQFCLLDSQFLTTWLEKLPYFCLEWVNPCNGSCPQAFHTYDNSYPNENSYNYAKPCMAIATWSARDELICLFPLFLLPTKSLAIYVYVMATQNRLECEFVNVIKYWFAFGNDTINFFHLSNENWLVTKNMQVLWYKNSCDIVFNVILNLIW